MTMPSMKKHTVRLWAKSGLVQALYCLLRRDLQNQKPAGLQNESQGHAFDLLDKRGRL